MLTVTQSGSLKHLEAFLKKASKPGDFTGILDAGGRQSVSALSVATPSDSRLASSSWGYEVSGAGGKYVLYIKNTDIENGFPVALRLQYGYSTGTGGYVPGRDYINPALNPIFKQISDKVWKAVTS